MEELDIMFDFFPFVKERVKTIHIQPYWGSAKRIMVGDIVSLRFGRESDPSVPKLKCRIVAMRVYDTFDAAVAGELKEAELAGARLKKKRRSSKKQSSKKAAEPGERIWPGKRPKFIAGPLKRHYGAHILSALKTKIVAFEFSLYHELSLYHVS